MGPTHVPGLRFPQVAAEGGGNLRLTVNTGLVLLLMLSVEWFTVLDVRGMMTLHAFLGIMLVGPVLLKVGSTLYRFVRYYAGDVTYVKSGPPPLLLRLIGPLLIVSTLALLGTGLGLLTVPPGKGWLVDAHQTCFDIWIGLICVHSILHLRESVAVGAREVREASRSQRIRLSVLLATLLVSVGAAAAFIPDTAPWINLPSGQHP